MGKPERLVLDMSKETWTWNSECLGEPARLARWGHFGAPVLIFPSAGGDFEEVERFQLVQALEPLLRAGRIKLYSVDGLGARSWLRATMSPEQCVRAQLQYDSFLYEEVVPRVQRDCLSESVELLAAGFSLGAYQAMAILARHPDAFRVAIGISGLYDLSGFLRKSSPGDRSPQGDFQSSSPLHFLPGMIDGPRLIQLRRRMFWLETGEGELETPAQSRRLAEVLEAKGIPHGLRMRGTNRNHEWSSWRELLPPCLAQFT